MWDKKQIDDELMKIHLSVPQEWRARLFHEVKKTPTTEFILQEAFKTGTMDEKKKEELERLMSSGYFSQTHKVLDEHFARKIDKHVENKIQHSIKLGKLPSREELETLPFYKQMYAKGNTKKVDTENKSVEGNG